MLLLNQTERKNHLCFLRKRTHQSKFLLFNQNLAQTDFERGSREEEQRFTFLIFWVDVKNKEANFYKLIQQRKDTTFRTSEKSPIMVYFFFPNQNWRRVLMRKLQRSTGKLICYYLINQTEKKALPLEPQRTAPSAQVKNSNL